MRRDLIELYREIKSASAGRDYSQRREFCLKYGWAIPDRKTILAIKAFANGGTILEINAGLGLWSRLLRDEGANVIATSPDARSNRALRWRHFEHTEWTDVEPCDARRAVEVYGERCDVLLSIWPPYQSKFVEKALVNFPGNRFVFVGEGRGGCTGGDGLFAELDANWTLVDTVEHPKWNHINDRTRFFRDDVR